MHVPKSPDTNDTTRRTRARRPLALLALAAVCLTGAPNAQSQQPARGGARPAKPVAAEASRSRRVADKTEARTQAATPTRVEGAATEATRPSAEAKRAEGPKVAAAEAGEVAGGTSEPEKDATKDAPKSAKAATPGGVEEIERLRAELKAAGPESRAPLQRELVERLVALGRQPEALSELRLMIHEDRFDPAFFYNTGNALARLGDATAATDAYRKAVSQRRGNYARALNNLGVVLTRQGRWDEAYDALNAALVQENLLYAEASYNLGRLHLLRGATNLALREWRRTLTLQPDHADAAAALARAYAEEGDEQRAAAVLENFTARAARAGASVPRQIAYAREAIAAPRADMREDAREDSRADSATPSASDARPNAAAARATLAAARPFELSSAAYNSFQSAREASEGGRHEEAARHYQSVIKKSGGYFPPANVELGLAFASLDRWYDAIEVLQPVADRDGARFPVAHYHLARLYERLGRYTTASEHFARASELYGDSNPQALVDLCRTRDKAGDTRGALAAIEAYSVAIAKHGSVPRWVVERADELRMKLRAAPVTNAKQ